jgi:hypothetical protein
MITRQTGLIQRIPRHCCRIRIVAATRKFKIEQRKVLQMGAVLLRRIGDSTCDCPYIGLEKASGAGDSGIKHQNTRKKFEIRLLTLLCSKHVKEIEAAFGQSK